MTAAALLYQPTRRWRIAAAFGAAALIHFAAIALANLNRVEITGGPPFMDNFPDINLEPPSTVDEPISETADPLPTPPPTNEFFPEQSSTPPPIRREINQRIEPIRRRGNSGSPGARSLSSAKVLAVSAPRPEYPYEARRQRITGDGIVSMTVDPVSGKVSDALIVKSTGSPFLDNAAMAGFRRWRFKPGTVSPVTCPITFTLTGASY